MRFLFVGDSHGDLRFLQHAIRVAKENEVDKIVQLGDFGYWEHRPHGVQFLDELENELQKVDMELHWIDGNHENHRLLRSKYPFSEPRFVPIRPRVFYIPRGTHWEWDGVHFLGIGGAYSIDSAERRRKFMQKTKHVPRHISKAKYETWWSEEMITDDEVHTALLSPFTTPVDVMLCHDVPGMVDLEAEFEIRNLRFFKLEPNTQANRAQLDKIAKVYSPQMILHGHYHVRYGQKVQYTNGITARVEGLDCNVNQYNRRPWSWAQALTVKTTEDIIGMRP